MLDPAKAKPWLIVVAALKSDLFPTQLVLIYGRPIVYGSEVNVDVKWCLMAHSTPSYETATLTDSTIGFIIIDVYIANYSNYKFIGFIIIAIVIQL